MAWGARLAVATGADLVAVSALGRDAPVSGRQVEEVEAGRLDELSGWITSEHTAGARLRTEVVFGDPRQALDAYSSEHGGDLVVVGRQGPGSAPGLMHLSSVAEYLVHHTAVPLAVVPDGAPAEIRRMVVAYDGSDNSHEAVRWCAAVSGATGASVVAVQVHEPFLEWTWEADLKAWHAATDQLIRDGIAADLGDAGIDLSVASMRGVRPADGLLQAVHLHGADVLVVGMRGLGGFTALRVGGVAMDALHGADTSMVLVPPAREA